MNFNYMCIGKYVKLTSGLHPSENALSIRLNEVSESGTLCSHLTISARLSSVLVNLVAFNRSFSALSAASFAASASAANLCFSASAAFFAVSFAALLIKPGVFDSTFPDFILIAVFVRDGPVLTEEGFDSSGFMA